jgi:hypothetical protein
MTLNEYQNEASKTALYPNSTRATGTRSAPASNQFASVGTVTFDASAAITEHGLFSQSATGGGTLWDRTVFSVINVVNGDSIQFTYTGTPTSNPSVIPTDIMDYLLKAFVLIGVGFTEMAKKILEYAYVNRQVVTEDKKSGTIPVTNFHETEVGKLFKKLTDNSKKLVELDQIAKVDTSKGAELEVLKEETEEVWKKLVDGVDKDQTEEDAKEAGIKKPVIVPVVASSGGGKVPPPLNPPRTTTTTSRRRQRTTSTRSTAKAVTNRPTRRTSTTTRRRPRPRSGACIRSSRSRSSPSSWACSWGRTCSPRSAR